MHQLISNLISPHYCCSCGATGTLLCEYCKYDIINSPYEACILCHGPAGFAQNKCGSCASAFTKVWCVGDRREGLATLIDRFKFERTRAAYLPLADLLDASLPTLPPDTTIVAIPTIAAHIRIRGYDQTRLVAGQFAKKRSLVFRPLLKRATNTVQRGAGRQQRIRQAAQAFASDTCSGRYLIIDDIATTGSTLDAAAKVLLAAGANEVWAAVVAVQPLDK